MNLTFLDADKVEAAWAYLAQFAIHQGLNCLAALAILVGGWWLAARAAQTVRRTFQHTHVDDTLRPMLASVVQWIVRVLTIVLVLSQFGVQTASIIAMLGAAGLAIGLALQGTLQNIAAGIMLVLLRPFRVGQYIDAQGVAGTVRETGLFMTELTTFDGVCLRVPNSKIWGSAITNYSENLTRRMDIEVTVTFDSEVGRGLEALRQMLAAEPRLLADPKPEVMVVRYTDRGITLNARYWTSNDDFWNVQYGFYARLKAVLNAAGCEIAVPVQEVRAPGFEERLPEPAHGHGNGNGNGRDRVQRFDGVAPRSAS
ncbi:mechanosensitive ion channel family protein [Cupriavidus plantarum]|uniref:mechanosensitive ion channel family protein n=1 Tax=Cupriavidus plantarum TaxID=942865 RepID=UPI001B08D620|nr:mechanosensitive ion channel family protein [Cupriavidus plantarum]CAG2146388.1 Small-conductance mechanosensitive channel [Cupriavidus plantarum]SMR86196.1 Small-conductance mechanosensitive channel [Cupriavidus plantarum]